MSFFSAVATRHNQSIASTLAARQFMLSDSEKNTLRRMTAADNSLHCFSVNTYIDFPPQKNGEIAWGMNEK